MTLVERLTALADMAEFKGKSLQRVPELKLVGNAYVGMSERIRQALKEETDDE